MKTLSEAQLRAMRLARETKEYAVDGDTFVTPMASEYLRERGITLVADTTPGRSRKPPAMPITPFGEGDQKYVDAVSGKRYREKPEQMTHLRGNQLVMKNHPQIRLRGSLDSLEAKVMEVQIMASDSGQEKIVEDLDELLRFIREILGCEVTGRPLDHWELLGMDSYTIRKTSQNVKAEIGIDHPVPSWEMGRLAVALNNLRTEVRKTELAAIDAFVEREQIQRLDLIEGLNRLSSCVYIIFCRLLAGFYGKGKAWTREEAANKIAGEIHAIRENTSPKELPVEVSGRHVHLDRDAVEKLFGENAVLTKVRDLSQPGQFLASQRVTLMTDQGEIRDVAVLGPERGELQVELSASDAHRLGISPPVRLSGDLDQAAAVSLVTENGKVKAESSTIIPRNHIHMTPEDAEEYQVRDGELVKVKMAGARPVTFEDVSVRVSRKFQLAMHIDVDEANACALGSKGVGYLVK